MAGPGRYGHCTQSYDCKLCEWLLNLGLTIQIGGLALSLLWTIAQWLMKHLPLFWSGTVNA